LEEEEVRMEIQKGMETMKEELGPKMEMAPHCWKEEEEEVRMEMVEKMVRWGCLLD
jgi:hypothetical protein